MQTSPVLSLLSLLLLLYFVPLYRLYMYVFLCRVFFSVSLLASTHVNNASRALSSCKLRRSRDSPSDYNRHPLFVNRHADTEQEAEGLGQTLYLWEAEHLVRDWRRRGRRACGIAVEQRRRVRRGAATRFPLPCS